MMSRATAACNKILKVIPTFTIWEVVKSKKKLIGKLNSLTSLYFYCFDLREEGNLKGNSRKMLFMMLQIVWFNISYHKSCCKSNKFPLLMYFVQSLHIFLQFVSYIYVQRNFLSYFPIENDLNWRGFANSYQMNDNREVYCTIFLSFLSPSGMQPTISLMKRIDWGFPPHLNIVLAILFKIESWREKK